MASIMTTSALVKSSSNASTILFEAGERWGWECRDVTKLKRSFSIPEPDLNAPLPDNQSLQAQLSKVENQRNSVVQLLAFLIPGILFLGALIGNMLTEFGVLEQVSRPIMFMIWIGGYWWLAREAIRRRGLYCEIERLQRQIDDERTELERARRQAHADWQLQKQAYEEKERRRIETLPTWGAVRPLAEARRVDVYGGSMYGWQSLVTTFGASLLGSGENLVILDFSEADVPARLFEEIERAGFPREAVKKVVLPQHQEGFDVFAGLDTPGIRDVLVEGLHTEDQENNPGTRSLVHGILDDICTILAPNITLERIDVALRFILRRKDSLQDPEGVLTPDELSRLAQSFNDEYRRAIAEHLVTLESQVHQLRSVGRKNWASSLGAELPRCVCISISRHGTTLLNELLANLLVQRLIRTLRSARQPAGSPTTIMVIGADVLKQRHLEKLDELAARPGLRIVYIFRHLRKDGLAVAGNSGSPVVFMQLGSEQEATAAADWISKGHFYRVSQWTLSKGSTRTVTWSDSVARGRSSAQSAVFDQAGGDDPIGSGTASTDSVSTSQGGSEAKSDQENLTIGRVEEHIVEKKVIRSLAPTALLFVEFVAEGQDPRVTFADCDPRIAARADASQQPFDERLPEEPTP